MSLPQGTSAHASWPGCRESSIHPSCAARGDCDADWSPAKAPALLLWVHSIPTLSNHDEAFLRRARGDVCDVVSLVLAGMHGVSMRSNPNVGIPCRLRRWQRRSPARGRRRCPWISGRCGRWGHGCGRWLWGTRERPSLPPSLTRRALRSGCGLLACRVCQTPWQGR